MRESTGLMIRLGWIARFFARGGGVNNSDPHPVDQEQGPDGGKRSATMHPAT